LRHLEIGHLSSAVNKKNSKP